MITINKKEELEKYYVKESNTYVFDNNVKFNIDINIDAGNIDAGNINAYDIKANDIKANDIKANNIKANNIDANNIKANNIDAYDIKANNIDANNIKANDIKAYGINANNINYYAFCISYNNINCKEITGRRKNSFHRCLDGEIIFKNKSCLDEETENAIKLLQDKKILGKDFRKELKNENK